MNKFSKKDIKALLNLSKEGTPLFEYLLEHGCTQEALKKLLLKLPNLAEYNVVFELPYKEVPKQIANPRTQGFILWRCEIGR